MSQATNRLAIADALHELMNQMGNLKDLAEGRSTKLTSVKIDLPNDVESINLSRIMNNLMEMNVVLGRINVNLNTIITINKK